MKASGAAPVSNCSNSPTAPVPCSRRQFLRLGTCLAAGPWLTSCRAPSRAPEPQPKTTTPNSRLSHACIGVGGMGWGDLQNFLQHPKVDIVALCDVDAENLD